MKLGHILVKQVGGREVLSLLSTDFLLHLICDGSLVPATIASCPKNLRLGKQ